MYLLSTAIVLSACLIVYYAYFGKIVVMPNNVMKLKNDCNMPKLRTDICYYNRLRPCPISSYAQCTNNQVPLNINLCENREFEISPLSEQYSERLFREDILEQPKLTIKPEMPKDGLRVNFYNTGKTFYESAYS